MSDLAEISFTKMMELFDVSQSAHQKLQQSKDETNVLLRMMYERVKNGERPEILIAMIADKLAAEGVALTAWETERESYEKAVKHNLGILSHTLNINIDGHPAVSEVQRHVRMAYSRVTPR